MIRISETTKKKFSGSLRQAMQELHVYGNCFISSSIPLKRLDEVVKFDSEIQRGLSTYISEDPLHFFCRDWLGRELYERDFDEEISIDEPIPLTALDGLPPIESLANELVHDFCKLPYEYKAFLPLHHLLFNLLKDDEDEYDYGGGIKIVRWSDELSSKFGKIEIKSASDDLFGDVEIEESSGPKVVLELSISGYFDRWNRGLTPEIAVERIKSFFGLCYATGLCETRDEVPLPADGLVTYRLDGDLPVANPRPLSLDDTFKRAFSQVAITRRAGFDLDRARGRVRKASSSLKSERILLASKWLFDSRGGVDQLFSFLQSTICLEILLGEQKYADNLSVGDILSNRCAYMVGRNDEDRENILKEFREIYAVRSEIVHRGKSRLSQQNKLQLSKLRGYCGRVIIKEIDLLATEK